MGKAARVESRAMRREAVAGTMALARPVKMRRDWYLELAVARAAAEKASTHLDLIARAAIDQGCSYVEVGSALGISKQAAWQRFGPQARTVPSKGRRSSAGAAT